MRSFSFLFLVCSLPLVASSAQEGNVRAEAIARTSPTAMKSWALLESTAAHLDQVDPRIRDAVSSLLHRPRPSFMKRYADPAAREKVRKELLDAGLLDAAVTAEMLFPLLPEDGRAPQSFLSAPANALHGHHSYPGGLAEHTAFNVEMARSYARVYGERYDLRGTAAVNAQLLAAAATLHDLMKPWVLQWKADGTLTVQAKVAGTASHHPFAVAEAFYRGLPAEFIVVLASAHDSPLGDSEARVVGFLRAGALLAGVDPVALGVLKEEGGRFRLAHAPSMEAVIHHLSDHDYVLTEPAAQVTDALLDRMARAEAGASAPSEAQLRWMHHRVQSQLPGVVLYRLLSQGGEAAVEAELRKKKLSLISTEDGRSAD